MSTAATTVLPKPLTTFKHPFRWTKNKIILLIDGLTFVHIGTLIIVALYYLAFQTIPGVKYDWDHLLTGGLHFWGWHIRIDALSDANWTYYRHMLRGVGEGLLGGFLGQVIIWNHFKKKVQKDIGEQSWIDRAEIALHIPNLNQPKRVSGKQLLGSPLLVIVYGIPGFALGALLVFGLHHEFAHLHFNTTTGSSYWDKLRAIDAGNYDQKIVGLFASIFVARRPGKKIYDDIQLWFVERRVAKDHAPRFYHPPVFKARYNNYIKERGRTAIRQQVAAGRGSHGGLTAALMSGGLFVGFLLACFGYYVLTVIA